VPGKRRVFDGLDLTIESGECVGIIGQEGMGKTTLLQLLDGLLKPDSGKVRIDGNDIWEAPKHLPELRRQIGFAFQFPEQHFFCESVKDEMEYSAKNFGGEKLAAEQVSKALHQVGLAADHFLGRSPFSLSIGEARRLALASLVVLRPRAMLLDEPTVGLDGDGVERTLDVLKPLHKQGVTMVIVSHELDFLAELVTRVVVLENGIKADEPARNLLTDPARLEIFGYSLPEAVQYVEELRRRGVTIPPGTLTVQEIQEVIAGQEGKMRLNQNCDDATRQHGE